MKVLLHHIYEYKKGLRNLVLHTLSSTYKYEAEKILKRQNINYIIREVTSGKINIFFGAEYCVEVLKKFGNKSLSDFTPEEDFILGIMLGYDQIRQCERYLKRISSKNQLSIYPNIINKQDL
jgi:hypothetical protein